MSVISDPRAAEAVPDAHAGSARPAVLTLLAVAALDLVLPADTSAAALYVVPILLASRALRGRRIVAFTVACSALIVLDWLVAPSLHGGAATERGLALLACWCTAGLRLVQLRQERRRREWAAVAVGSREAIAAMDGDGVIREWNAQAEQLYGHAAAEVVGRRADEALGCTGSTLMDAVRGLGHGQVMETFHDEHRTQDGKSLTVAVTLSPVRSSDGEVIGVSATLRDVTLEMRAQFAQARSEERFRALSVELERQARHKDDFISMLGHELRNPLGAIGNAAGVLRIAEAGSGRAERALEIIESQVSMMRRQVDDILDLSRLARGELQLERRPVAVREIVEMAVDSMAEHLRASGISARVAPIDPELRVQADRFRLGQVMHNLLDNAAKFTEQQGAVRIEAAADDENVTISVTDQGIGIDPALLPYVFEEFAQAEQHVSRQSGGMGLGLAVCKRIVELHGGEIEVESDGVAGHGACFRFSLPRYLGEAESAEVDERGTAAGRETSKHVMVADDNVAALQALTDFLELNGYRVTAAIDGEGVLQAFEGEEPDVLVLDIGLPGRDGFEVARLVRERWPERTCRLIAVTGYGSAQVAERARAAGFDHYLVKPVSLEQLREALD